LYKLWRVIFRNVEKVTHCLDYAMQTAISRYHKGVVDLAMHFY